MVTLRIADLGVSAPRGNPHVADLEWIFRPRGLP